MYRLRDLLDTPRSGDDLLAELYPPAGARDAARRGADDEPPNEAMRELARRLAASDWSGESAIREQLRHNLASRPDNPSVTRFASVLGGLALAWIVAVLFLSPLGGPAGADWGAAGQHLAMPTESPTVTVARTNGAPTATAAATAPADDAAPKGAPSPIATGQIMLGSPTLSR